MRCCDMATATGTTKRYRYFLYSQSQYIFKTETEEKIGKTYIPGRVLASGRWKDFTEISTTPSNNKFADAKIVAEGYLEDMTYQMSKSEWRRRR